MAYQTGTVGSLADLLTAIRTFCTASGWTLSGEVLHRAGCFTRLYVSGSDLRIVGGTGIDGANNLTGANGFYCRIAKLAGDPFSFPMTYHLFAHGDEVYAVVNHDSQYYHWLAFGRSGLPGLPGTGGWYGASLGQVDYSSTGQRIFISPAGGGGVGTTTTAALFWHTNDGGTYVNAFLNTGLESASSSGWNFQDNSNEKRDNAVACLAPMIARQPSVWNGESILLPIAVLSRRPSNKSSFSARLAHARYVRVDNYESGAIIEYGSDRWKVFPWYKKDAVNRDGGTYVGHTGTFGWAIRYDGP